MKVLVNGGLNLSELDGWWAEAYTPEVGWALGDGKEHGDNPSWDAAEATTLYDLLEQQAVPEFYNRNAEGMPTAWVARIRESMARLTPYFSANRTVREYTEQHYLSAAANYLERTANNGALAKQIIDWKHNLQEKWYHLRFGEVKIETKDNLHHFEVPVYIDDLPHHSIKVQLYASGPNENSSELQEMTQCEKLPGDINTYLYRASVPAKRPAIDYTPRLIPKFLTSQGEEGVSVPLETSQILWQK